MCRRYYYTYKLTIIKTICLVYFINSHLGSLLGTGSVSMSTTSGGMSLLWRNKMLI